MEIIRTFEDAFAIGKECILKINKNKPRPRLLDNYVVPINTMDGPWEMSEHALYQTLSYIMNFLNHSCYMLCVSDKDYKMVKLETREMSSFFRDILTKDIAAKQDSKITSALVDERSHKLKNMRIMQCVVKPYAAESGVSKEYQQLLSYLDLPDGVYILNLTDAVLLRKGGLIPWKLNRDLRLPVSYRIEKFVPILSISGEEGYWDIPIPNYDDVQYVLQTVHPATNYELDWSKKIPKAVFRGGPTGCGVTEETNMRIRLARMGLNSKYADMLDVGVVSNKPNTIDAEGIRYDPRLGLAYMQTHIKPVSRMSMVDQSKFRYIIHIDGNVHAYRLLTTMRTGSLILRVMSPYRSWIDHLMDMAEAEGNPMYVPVRADLSNLISKIEWCNSHSDECREIAERARVFAETAMTMDFVSNAINAVGWKLHENILSATELKSAKVGVALQDRYAIVDDTNEIYVRDESVADGIWRADPILKSMMHLNLQNADNVLCVLQDMCLTDVATNECETEEMASVKVQTNLMKQFYNTFDRAYFVSREELYHRIEEEAKHASDVYPLLKKIEMNRKMEYNNQQYAMGKTASVGHLPISPHQGMIDAILSDTDESRQRRLIITLIESQKYVYQGVSTEESRVYPNEKESDWWYYCNQTHVKLVPRFKYVLASASLRTPLEYEAIRSNLIQEIGEQNDDGIYDRHTGVQIQSINFITDEGFDEAGFRIKTRDILPTEQPQPQDNDDDNEDMMFDEFENADGHVDEAWEREMEKDDADAMIEAVATDEQIMIATGEVLLDSINNATFKLTFPPDVIEAVQMLMEQLREKLHNAYEQYILKKPKDPYTEHDYMDIQEANYWLIIYIYLVELFVSKTVIMHKVAPDAQSTDASITELLTKYIATNMVSLLKSKKTRKAWPRIYYNKFMDVETKAKHIGIAKFIELKRPEVIKLSPFIATIKQAVDKTLAVRYATITTKRMNATPWPQFLPPQNVDGILSIPTSAELDAITKTHKNTASLIAKMIYLSFCIQRTIQTILDNDEHRLSKLLNVRVYLQMNACCLEQINEENIFDSHRLGNTLEFFNRHSPHGDLIKRYNTLIAKIDAHLFDMRMSCKSLTLNINTGIQYPVLSHTLNRVVMEEGIQYLTHNFPKLFAKGVAAKADDIKTQFMHDYLIFSRQTMHSPPEFPKIHLPLIELISTLQTYANEDLDFSISEEQKGEFQKIAHGLNAVFNGREDNKQDDVLFVLNQYTANKIKLLPKTVVNSIEKTFTMFKDAHTDINYTCAVLNFLSNYVVLLCKVYPTMFKNRYPAQKTLDTLFNNSWLPNMNIDDKEDRKKTNKYSSWEKFHYTHADYLKKYITDNYTQIDVYLDKSSNSNSTLKQFWNFVQNNNNMFVKLASATYYQPPRSTEKDEIAYTVGVFLSLFRYYIVSALFQVNVKYRQIMSELDDENTNLDDETEKEIELAYSTYLKVVSTNLHMTAQTDLENKSYKFIQEIVFKHKENEKNKFRKRLEKMTHDERFVYQEERKLGVGEYDARNYAGLKKYDPKFYAKTSEMRAEFKAQEQKMMEGMGLEGDEDNGQMNVDETEAEQMARADGADEDGDYNNVFEDDGYY